MTSMVNANPSGVLVHGAYADGSSWSGVIKRLHAAGITATAVQNPLTSLADDVRAMDGDRLEDSVYRVKTAARGKAC